MITLSGRHVFPDNDGVPTLDDIAVGLARQVRFAGHTEIPYSVLQHTMVMTSFMPVEYRIFGLIHDAHEAIMGDTPRFWKHPEVKAYEQDLDERLTRALELPWPWPEVACEHVTRTDLQSCIVEAKVLGFAGWVRPEPDVPPPDRMYAAVARMIPMFSFWMNDPSYAVRVYKAAVQQSVVDWFSFSRETA